MLAKKMRGQLRLKRVKWYWCWRGAYKLSFKQMNFFDMLCEIEVSSFLVLRKHFYSVCLTLSDLSLAQPYFSPKLTWHLNLLPHPWTKLYVIIKTVLSYYCCLKVFLLSHSASLIKIHISDNFLVPEPLVEVVNFSEFPSGSLYSMLSFNFSASLS